MTTTKAIEAIAAELLAARATGGTVSTTDTSVPSAGYVLGIAGLGAVLPKGNIDAIAHWVALHLDASHVGIWSDSATGETYLDVVRVIADRSIAELLAKATGEIAIWDLANKVEVRV